MKLKALLFLLIVALFGFVSPVRAFEMRKGEDVTVPIDSVVKGSLVAAGNTVTIEGTIDGDLYCAGQTIVVRGKVNGDVICGAQTISISGTVGGSVRVAGQLLDISGTVKRNVTAMGQTMTLSSTGIVTGEFMAAGQSMFVQGTVGQGLLAAGQTVNLNSNIGGDVQADAESILLGEKTRIAGNFTYTSPTAASEATGAAITGKISHIISKKLEPKPLTANKLMPKAKPWPANAIGSIVFYLVFGALVVLIAKAKVLRITQQMLARPWFDGFVGFLTMIGAPIAIVMVAITIIGIPVAIILGIIFAVMIVVSRVYVSVIVGAKLLSAIGKKKSGLLLQVVTGVIIIEILAKVPVLGFFVTGIATLWGLGGIVLSFRKQK